MTLATFLFFAILAITPVPRTWQQTPATSTQADGAVEKQEGSSSEQKSQSNAAPAQSSAKASTSTSSSRARRRQHKKKAVKPDCATAGTSANNPATASADPASGQTAAQKAGTQTPTNCPPPKIVVQKGGTTEPSIQLAGTPSPDQATQKRDAVNQLLEATDQNLKKTTGLQLSTEQQDTVSQARQFVEQSKTALAAGDLERARTLAWKAEVLSEDLVKPQK